MLTEILCDKFIDDGRPRGSIRFSTGLNVVLGPENATNSIGKSTMLLIIDYAFGGSTYSSVHDIEKNVGNHAIKFAHSFEGPVYRFSRSFDQRDVVYRCDAAYKVIDDAAMSLRQFNEWLCEMYGLSGLGATFRELVSCFFRAYGKDNYDEKKPLASRPGESPKKGAERLLRLYGEYGAIDAVSARLDEVKDKKKTFDDACRLSYVSSASNRSEFNANERCLSSLRADLAEVVESTRGGLDGADPVAAGRIAELKRRRANLKRERTKLKSKIAVIESADDLDKFRSAKDFGELSAFFPGVDIKKIEEVEWFHASIAKVLQKERRDEIGQLQDQARLLDSAIEEISGEISEYGASPSITAAAFKAYAGLASEIDRLEKANDAYEEKRRLKNDVNQLIENRRVALETVLRNVSSQVNSELATASEAVCGVDQIAPVLHFSPDASYTFNTPDDTGTGSRARSMMLLDYVVLSDTPLPAITEDTVSIKQVGDEATLRCLELFDATDKQVFIAFDKAGSYGDGNIPAVIARNTVIELADGHELFGKSWSRKSAR